MLVIVADGIRSEGLLEPGYDWYVQRVAPLAASLHSNEFNAVLASWKQKIVDTPRKKAASIDLSDMTVGQIVATIKPAHLWSVLVALGAALAGSFALGVRLAGGG